MPAEKKPRAQKKAETRRKIVQAALELFTEKGFEATTIEELSLRAGCGRRTFFRYFPSKDDVVFSDEGRRQKLFLEAACLPENCCPQTRLFAGFSALSADYSSQRSIEASRYQIIIASPALVARQWRSFLSWEGTLSQALIGPSAAPQGRAARLQSLACALTAIFSRVLRAWLDNPASGDLRAMALIALQDLSQSFEEAKRCDRNIGIQEGD